MHRLISSIEDISLDLFDDVTRRNATAELSPQLAEKIDTRRGQFLDYVAGNRNAHLYGITTRHHVGAKHVLDADGYDEFASRLPASGASFGERLPERLVRGIVISRLADYINGTGCLRSATVARILDLLERPELPKLPLRGNGEPGDIIPLGYLFRELFNGSLEVGEGMAMINGSPVAAAALADAAVGSRNYAKTLELTFALAAFAVSAPLQHFDEKFESLWNDPFIAETVSNIRGYLEGGEGVEFLAYQAPVSFRSMPRVLGWFRRTQSTVEELASSALRTSSNNPAFVGPDEVPPFGAVLSNGGYHSPYASPALDSLTRSYADVTQMLAALTNQVMEISGGLLSLEPESEVSTLYHVTTGWAEEARAAATVSLISLGNGGQTDTSTLDLLAWRKSNEAAQALEAASTVLAVAAAHTVARKNIKAAGELASFQEDILRVFPVGTKPLEFDARLSEVQALIHQTEETITV